MIAGKPHMTSSRSNLVSWWWAIASVLFGAGWLLVAPAFAQDQADPSWRGTYRDEHLTVELNYPSRSAGRTIYTGTIQTTDQKFPLRGELTGTRLKGTFQSGGDKWEFTADLDGSALVFTTGGTTYHLANQLANPLARPAKPNPLALPKSTAPQSTNRIAGTDPSAARPTVAPSKGKVLVLQRKGLPDDPIMIGGEAFSVLLPIDWEIEGGVTWRMNPTAPACLAVRLSKADRTEAVEVLPTIPFVWAEGGIPFFPPGSNYLGNIVAPPMDNAADYIKDVIVPRYRRSVGARIVTSQVLPRMADAIAQGSEESGIQKKFHAARVRLEYPENGRLMEEDVYCVLLQTTIPSAQTTFWGADRNYAFKAEKGKLDLDRRLFQAIVTSILPTFQWFNRYVQLLQILSQNPLNTTRPVVELAQYIQRTTSDTDDLRRGLFERQQSALSLLNGRLNQALGGLAEYQNPFNRQAVDLPSGYASSWASPNGEFLLASDPDFDPNQGSEVTWRRLEPVR
jgi:hypothetical protein